MKTAAHPFRTNEFRASERAGGAGGARPGTGRGTRHGRKIAAGAGARGATKRNVLRNPRRTDPNALKALRPPPLGRRGGYMRRGPTADGASPSKKQPRHPAGSLGCRGSWPAAPPPPHPATQSPTEPPRAHWGRAVPGALLQRERPATDADARPAAPAVAARNPPCRARFARRLGPQSRRSPLPRHRRPPSQPSKESRKHTLIRITLSPPLSLSPPLPPNPRSLNQE